MTMSGQAIYCSGQAGYNCNPLNAGTAIFCHVTFWLSGRAVVLPEALEGIAHRVQRFIYLISLAVVECAYLYPPAFYHVSRVPQSIIESRSGRWLIVVQDVTRSA